MGVLSLRNKNKQNKENKNKSKIENSYEDFNISLKSDINDIIELLDSKTQKELEKTNFNEKISYWVKENFLDEEESKKIYNTKNKYEILKILNHILTEKIEEVLEKTLERIKEKNKNENKSKKQQTTKKTVEKTTKKSEKLNKNIKNKKQNSDFEKLKFAEEDFLTQNLDLPKLPKEVEVFVKQHYEKDKNVEDDIKEKIYISETPKVLDLKEEEKELHPISYNVKKTLDLDENIDENIDETIENTEYTEDKLIKNDYDKIDDKTEEHNTTDLINYHKYEREYEKYEDLFKPKKEELEEIKKIEENLKRKEELLDLKEKELEEELYYIKEKNLSLEKLDSALKKIEMLKKENDLLKKQLYHLKNIISDFKQKIKSENEILFEELDETPERIKLLEEEEIFKPKITKTTKLQKTKEENKTKSKTKSIVEDVLKQKIIEEKNLSKSIEEELEEDIKEEKILEQTVKDEKEKNVLEEDVEEKSLIEKNLDLMQIAIQKKQYEKALEYLRKAKKEFLKEQKLKRKNKKLNSIEKVKDQMLEYELKTLEEDIKILMLKNA